MFGERRKCTRISFNNECTVTVGEQSYEARLIDISVKGALIEMSVASPSEWGELCDLKIVLDDGVSQMKLRCRAVHREQHRVGLYFILTDAESLTHLRNLVALNMGDAEKTLDELFLWSSSDATSKDRSTPEDIDL